MESPILNQYRRICTDESYRKALIDDPRTVISNEYQCEIPADVKIEIIEQRTDTITLVVPVQPVTDSDEPITRVVDLLFEDGIGGFLIPNEKLKWVLRDMRNAWLASISKSKRV